MCTLRAIWIFNLMLLTLALPIEVVVSGTVDSTVSDPLATALPGFKAGSTVSVSFVMTTGITGSYSSGAYIRWVSDGTDVVFSEVRLTTSATTISMSSSEVGNAYLAQMLTVTDNDPQEIEMESSFTQGYIGPSYQKWWLLLVGFSCAVTFFDEPYTSMDEVDPVAYWTPYLGTSYKMDTSTLQKSSLGIRLVKLFGMHFSVIVLVPTTFQVVDGAPLPSITPSPVAEEEIVDACTKLLSIDSPIGLDAITSSPSFTEIANAMRDLPAAHCNIGKNEAHFVSKKDQPEYSLTLPNGVGVQLVEWGAAALLIAVSYNSLTELGLVSPSAKAPLFILGMERMLDSGAAANADAMAIDVTLTETLGSVYLFAAGSTTGKLLQSEGGSFSDLGSFKFRVVLPHTSVVAGYPVTPQPQSPQEDNSALYALFALAIIPIVCCLAALYFCRDAEVIDTWFRDSTSAPPQEAQPSKAIPAPLYPTPLYSVTPSTPHGAGMVPYMTA